MARPLAADGTARTRRPGAGRPGELADDFRTVLVLREIDGHPYDAIAEMLDLPLGTVRSRLHRARMELREQLKGVLIEEA